MYAETAAYYDRIYFIRLHPSLRPAPERLVSKRRNRIGLLLFLEEERGSTHKNRRCRGPWLADLAGQQVPRLASLPHPLSPRLYKNPPPVL